VDRVGTGWFRVFNSFGFIALLVCGAVLLTTISFSNADESRDTAGNLLMLQSQGALLTDIQVTHTGDIEDVAHRN
jgi:hypothetical protein